jgi:hypothetical protein
MDAVTLDELKCHYAHFKSVSDHCAHTADYSPFADLFTEDCLYIEHVFGEMRGRETVRAWIVPLMQSYPNNQMVKYTHDWVYFNPEAAEVVFCARTHMTDLGDGKDYTTTNWTRLKYAGGGLFSFEEDIYNPANFIALIQRWEAAANAK